MLKIGVVIHTFDPSKSGKEKFNWHLVHGLLERGHRVELIAHEVKGIEHSNLVVHNVAMRGKPLGVHRWWFARSARRAVEKLDLDVVFTNGKSMFGDVVRIGGSYRGYIQNMIDSKRSKVSKFLYWLSKKCSISAQLATRLEKKTFLNPNLKRIIVNTKALKQELLRFYPELSKKRISVIYNGVDLEAFDFSVREGLRVKIRNQFEISVNQKVALFVGNEFKRKGLDYFLRMIETKTDWVGIVVGEDQLPVLNPELHEKIFFTGGVDEVAPYYAASDCLVLPSRSDGFVLVALEALAFGLFISLSDRCGAAEIIENREIGHVFSLGADPVPERLESVVFDKSLRQKRVEFARKFTWDTCVGEYERVFREVTG